LYFVIEILLKCILYNSANIHHLIVTENKLRRVELLMKLYLRATGCDLPYGITRCYLSCNTSEHTPP